MISDRGSIFYQISPSSAGMLYPTLPGLALASKVKVAHLLNDPNCVDRGITHNLHFGKKIIRACGLTVMAKNL